MKLKQEEDAFQLQMEAVKSAYEDVIVLPLSWILNIVEFVQQKVVDRLSFVESPF